MSSTSPRLVVVAQTWALIIIGLNAAASLFAEAWAWSLWPATYLPVQWRLGLALLAAVVALFGEPLWQKARGPLVPVLVRLKLSSPLARLAVSVAAGVLFYLLRLRHLTWGDAYILVKSLGDPYRITYVWQAPLDVFVHAKLWQAGNAMFGWPDPTPAYNIISVLAGAAFVYILLTLAQMLGRNRTERALIVGLVATLGTMELFFGYIENYSIMTTGMLLYAWLALRTLRGELRIVWPATVLALTHAFHPSTIILIPSLLYVLWNQRNILHTNDVSSVGSAAEERGTGATVARSVSGSALDTVSPHRVDRKRFVRSVVEVAAPYAVVLVGVVALMEGGDHGLAALATVDFPGGGDRQWFVPLLKVTTRWQHYTMFSLGHLVDILNQQLLVAPVIWPMLIATAVLSWRRLPLMDPAFRFLSLMALFYLLLTLTWNADYGGQRDWDLFSPAAVPAAVLLGYVLPRALPQPSALRSAGWALIAAQSYHTLTWIIRNTRP